MTVKCDINYLVRVTKAPPDPQNALLIYSVPTPGNLSAPVNTISVIASKYLCFTEDPASTVKNLVLSVDSCENCTKPGDWDNTAKILSVHFSGPGGALLLDAASLGGAQQRASQNPPGIEGGRPIIRIPPYLFVAVGLALLAIVVIGYYAYKRRTDATIP